MKTKQLTVIQTLSLVLLAGEQLKACKVALKVSSHMDVFSSQVYDALNRMVMIGYAEKNENSEFKVTEKGEQALGEAYDHYTNLVSILREVLEL